MPDNHPPGLLMALWLAFLAFIRSLFARSPSPAALPMPIVARTSTRVTHPTASSRSPPDVFHSPFPNISFSGIFATPPLLASPRLHSDIELGRLQVSPPFRDSLASPHTLHSASPRTPRTPSSAVIVRLDRSTVSPTTMSDGSLQIISLSDRRGFAVSPIKITDIGRLPSPWSPIGKMAASNVWVSADGMLRNATGPVDILAQSRDDSAASRIALHSLSRISSASLYSSSSALDALGISVFVNLDESDRAETRDAPTSVPKLNQVRDENRPTLVTQSPQTPRKRRDTLPSVTRAVSHSARATKHFSTPLTKMDNVDLGHVRSATSISSMAYELRMGLLADGRSMTGLQNIISLLDQASPPHNNVMRPVEAG